jgi:hypothetical protein
MKGLYRLWEEETLRRNGRARWGGWPLLGGGWEDSERAFLGYGVLRRWCLRDVTFSACRYGEIAALGQGVLRLVVYRSNKSCSEHICC